MTTENLMKCPAAGSMKACSVGSEFGCRHAGDHVPKVFKGGHPDTDPKTDCGLLCGKDPDHKCVPVIAEVKSIPWRPAT